MKGETGSIWKAAIIGLLVAACGCFLITFGIMHLWNWLDGDIFHVHQFTFWQTAGMLLLLGIVGIAVRAILGKEIVVKK